jgi:glycosyltransferase involved in cell wall biosynthesis
MPEASAPPISVIIPCFNCEMYVVASVRSVYAQRWPRIEVIVVDDGSTDRSAELVRANFPDVRLIQQPNQGVAAARNNGLAHATGEWIAFLDADDIWLENKLAMQWALLQGNPGARMGYAAWHVWQSDAPEPAGELLEQLRADATVSDRTLPPGTSGWIYPALLLDCVVWTSTVLVHRSVFDEVGVFDTGLRIGEDYDLWLRASRVTKILRVPDKLALYRTHPASITKSAPTRNYQGIVIQRALDRWGFASPDGTLANSKTVNGGLARTWTNYGSACLTAGQTRKAWECGLLSLRANWKQVVGWKLLAKTALRTMTGSAGKSV